MFSIPVYFVIALKRFYGQKLGEVILKFMAISFLYNFIFWIIVGFVFLKGISKNSFASKFSEFFRDNSNF
jgi:hypothetical protein